MLGLFKWLLGSSSPDEDKYITNAHPEHGGATMVYDTLGAEAPDSLRECDSSSGTGLDVESSAVMLFDDEPSFLVNPSTGLPMVDELMDVSGNFFGTEI